MSARMRFTTTDTEDTEEAQREEITESKFEIAYLSVPPLRSLCLCGEPQFPIDSFQIKPLPNLDFAVQQAYKRSCVILSLSQPQTSLTSLKGNVMNPQPKISTVIAKTALLLPFVCLILFFMVKTVLMAGFAQSPESVTQERNLKLKSFKDIPVTIHQVRNLKSDTWHQDLEIEVKNVSNKPIYFMLVYLVFPDDPVPPGGESAIRLMYGDPRRNGRIDRYAHLEDEHIEPGETYVFTIPEIDRKGLKAKHEKFPERTKNLFLRFAIINFGDGTGFIAGESRDYRGKGYTPPPPEERLFKKISWHSLKTITATQDGCGDCFRWLVDPAPDPTSCYCSSTLLASTSPDEPCRRLRLEFIDCDGDGVPGECHDDAIDTEGSASCPGATPTPEPTATTTPTPTPPCPPEDEQINPRCGCVDGNSQREKQGKVLDLAM
jgi:hypothetical protein